MKRSIETEDARPKKQANVQTDVYQRLDELLLTLKLVSYRQNLPVRSSFFFVFR